jgi:hypothetical protein
MGVPGLAHRLGTHGDRLGSVRAAGHRSSSIWRCGRSWRCRGHPRQVEQPENGPHHNDSCSHDSYPGAGNLTTRRIPRHGRLQTAGQAWPRRQPRVPKGQGVAWQGALQTIRCWFANSPRYRQSRLRVRPCSPRLGPVARPGRGRHNALRWRSTSRSSTAEAGRSPSSRPCSSERAHAAVASCLPTPTPIPRESQSGLPPARVLRLNPASRAVRPARALPSGGGRSAPCRDRT